jgi:purine-nucleoside/S-methyl-5'-thioadenosine phosphorylase / adenosine deaminase
METIIDDSELRQAGFSWRVSDGVRALICDPLESEGFTNGFSTRLGGVSRMPENALNLAGFNEDAAENILENRRRFLKLFPGEWSLAGCWQVHGTDVRLIREVEEAKPIENASGETVYCDSIVSDTPKVLAAVKTADCVPLLIGDPKKGAFVAVHAGWRGTLAGIASHSIKQLVLEYDTKPRDLRVAIGPAARGCCYEVGNDVIEMDDLITPVRNHHALIDLVKANRYQLLSAGVDDKRIHLAPFCTMCRPDLFFSYRCEKRLHGKVGRLMAVVGRAQ